MSILAHALLNILQWLPVTFKKSRQALVVSALTHCSISTDIWSFLQLVACPEPFLVFPLCTRCALCLEHPSLFPLFACSYLSFKVQWGLIQSVQFSHSVVSDSLRPHEPQHARPPCPSPTPGVYSNSCPLSQWCHPTISSSVVPFFSCPQSLSASGSFPMSQLFAWGGQSIGVSASSSVLPVNTQDWSPSGWTGWISLQSKGLSRAFSNTTVQKHQFFSTQLSL